MEPKLILLPNNLEHNPRTAIEEAISAELGKSVTIGHRANGSPYLNEDTASISISHCRTTLGVLIGPRDSTLGIDVEDKWTQAQKVFKRFATQEELSILKHIDPIHPLWLWTAKEAVYKAFSTHVSHFSRDIRLTGVKKGGKLQMLVSESIPVFVQCKLYNWHCAVSIVTALDMD